MANFVNVQGKLINLDHVVAVIPTYPHPLHYNIRMSKGEDITIYKEGEFEKLRSAIENHSPYNDPALENMLNSVLYRVDDMVQRHSNDF